MPRSEALIGEDRRHDQHLRRSECARIPESRDQADQADSTVGRHVDVAQELTVRNDSHHDAAYATAVTTLYIHSVVRADD